MAAAGPRDLDLVGLALEATPSITLDNGRVLEAPLVVGADGARSDVRELAGIGWRETTYGQRAFLTNIELDHPHARVARQRFLATGPIAALPLAEPHAVSIVWSCDDERADELEAADDKAALADLYQHRLNAGGDDVKLVELYVKQAELRSAISDYNGAKAALRSALTLQPERAAVIIRGWEVNCT